MKTRGIAIHRYKLRSAGGLNSASSKTEFEGALIRVEGGYGCLHPWPELGDEPLDQQLEKLAQGKMTPLIRQALACAKIDGEARRESLWLFDALTIPRSHFTAVGPAAAANPEVIRGEGFTTVKLKSHADWKRWFDGGLRIRVDLNETGTVDELLHSWNRLSNEARESFDFFEDPVPFDEADWSLLREAGIPLAADRDLEKRAEFADWLVVKPAVTEIPKSDRKIVITSYMDHAIGQLWAAYRAAVHRIDLDCGLLTHELFRPDPFFAELKRDGPYLIPPDGTGLGFDELLAGLDWESLT
ncbi:MAG: hypothetical protein HKN23_03485 [Verrucomicrobiales bacterium]|nr:hypothetical protein [Verrucomicrobiales bacterium]